MHLLCYASLRGGGGETAVSLPLKSVVTAPFLSPCLVTAACGWRSGTPFDERLRVTSLFFRGNTATSEGIERIGVPTEALVEV